MAEGRTRADWYRDRRLARAIAAVWLSCAAALLWQAGPGARASYSLDADDPYAAFVFATERVQAALDGSSFGALLPGNGVTVLHLGDPDCRCTRRTAPHRSRIQDAYAGRTVNFVTIGIDDPRARTLWDAVPATPAAIVVDEQGKVAYVGPYSKDGTCLEQGGEGPVEWTLDAMLTGQSSRTMSPLGAGCLCATEGKGAIGA
jgi:hypothetical protein